MVKEKVDISMIETFLEEHYESKAQMARSLGITPQHLQAIFEGRGVGKKFIYGLKNECERLKVNHKYFFIPDPFILGEEFIQSIEVFDENDELIASITSENIISHNRYKVIVQNS